MKKINKQKVVRKYSFLPEIEDLNDDAGLGDHLDYMRNIPEILQV